MYFRWRIWSNYSEKMGHFRVHLSDKITVQKPSLNAGHGDPARVNKTWPVQIHPNPSAHVNRDQIRELNSRHSSISGSRWMIYCTVKLCITKLYNIQSGNPTLTLSYTSRFSGNPGCIEIKQK
jgi:hypothetical protein